MLSITRDEAEVVRKIFPYVHIRRTVNKYYMEENKKAVLFIKSLHEEGVTNER